MSKKKVKEEVVSPVMVEETPTPPPVPAVLEGKCSMVVRMKARQMYVAYNENVGLPFAPWDLISVEERSHWCAAVLAVLPHLNDV